MFSVPYSIAFTLLGEERANLSVCVCVLFLFFVCFLAHLSSAQDELL